MNNTGVRMNRQQRRHRLTLTLIITVFHLLFFLVALMIVGCAVFLLAQGGIITGHNEADPSVARVILAYGIPSLFISALLTSIFGKYTMGPVKSLIAQMDRLAQGDYRARIDFGGLWKRVSAIAELEKSFNTMAQELESTEKLRSEFINNFSHEFKTPIVSIAGFAKLLRKGNISPAQQEEYLEIIEEESLRLAQMATNVLDLTKVENQTILTNVTCFNLSEQIRSSMLLLEPKWEKRELDLCMDFDEYMIRANEELLRHVWINLLDNAIKFTPNGGEIEVRIARKEDILCVSVRNTGSEIPPEVHKKIFNKFYQADESHSSLGYGVGLSLVKGVVELHRGVVGVTSADGMTTFTVELPCGELGA